jgi:hypothetical protein
VPEVRPVSVAEAIATAAPYYNLVFVLVALYLWYHVLKAPTVKGVFLAPWKLILVGVLMFIVETLLTILRAAGVITIGRHINGFFELVIIITFIYALLLQKEYIVKQKF